LGLIQDLAKATSFELEQTLPASWLWRGHQVKLLDGSTLSMPDTVENQGAWPQNSEQRPGLGFPTVRIVALISLATAAILDARLGPWAGGESSETALARQMLDNIKPGDVILADRYFAGYFFIALVAGRGAHIITRQFISRVTDFRRGTRLGQDDHVVELVKPPRPKWMDEQTYAGLPKTLELREVKAGTRDRQGRDIVVVTTLVDPKKYPRTELLAASKMRWQVELDLRSIKSVMGMDILSCRAPDMIQKEVWTYILAYNLVRELIVRAAEKHGLEPRQISFTGALQTFNAFAVAFDDRDPALNKRLYDAMIDSIASWRIGNRPGRHEPKVVKRRRDNRYPKMTRPRHAYHWTIH
jgi:putative transposase